MRQVAHQSDIISAAGKDLTPKFANIAIASSGDNIIVAAAASKKLRVVSAFMIAAGDVDATSSTVAIRRSAVTARTPWI